MNHIKLYGNLILDTIFYMEEDGTVYSQVKRAGGIANILRGIDLENNTVEIHAISKIAEFFDVDGWGLLTHDNVELHITEGMLESAMVMVDHLGISKQSMVNWNRNYVALDIRVSGWTHISYLNTMRISSVERSADTILSFDLCDDGISPNINLRRDIDLLKQCDFGIMSMDDYNSVVHGCLGSDGTISRTDEYLLALNPNMNVVTHQPNASYIVNSQHKAALANPFYINRCGPKNLVGAGDVFCGKFISSYDRSGKNNVDQLLTKCHETATRYVYEQI